MLLFRDWLRCHPVNRELDERAEVVLANRGWEYTQNYVAEKSAVVQEILARLREAGGSG